MISGHGNIETAVSAIKLGAYDFIEKPFKADRLILIADRALETSRLKREVSDLRVALGRDQPAGRLFGGDQQSAAHHRAGRSGQFAHSHFRSGGRRQGIDGAAHPRTFEPRRRAVRRHQRADDDARPDGERIVRRRGRARPARGRSARSRRRMAARSISTKWPTCRWRRRPKSCACWSTRISSASAARPAFMSTCASFPRPAAISPRRSPTAPFARICFIACRWCRSARPRCRSGARTFPN